MNTPIQNDNTAVSTTITRNGVEITLAEIKGKGRLDKSTGVTSPGVMFYGLDMEELEVYKTDQAGTKTVDEQETINTLVKLVGYEGFSSRILVKLNQDMKAAQLDEGKDTLTLLEKLIAARQYINNGFGAARAASESKAMRLETKVKDLQATMLRLSQGMQRCMLVLNSPSSTSQERVSATQDLAKLQAEMVSSCSAS